VKKGSGWGWIPFVWLVYLVGIPLELAGRHATPQQWTFELLGVTVFLPIYFAGYRFEGKPLVWIIAALAALGAIYAPGLAAATVYFIYAAGFIGFAVPSSLGYRWLAGYVALVAAYCYVAHVPVPTLISAVVFSALIGAVCVRQAEMLVATCELRRAREEVERMAQVAERERIARDLHDVLGHTLSLIVIKSELASKLAERGDERAVVEIRDVEKIARESLAELREALAGYRAAGIAAEVARARSTLESAGIAVDYAGDDVRLPAAQETVLSLALREGVTNVVRHARASTCRLRLAQSPELCRLEIADDGTGGGEREGLGLLGMRERVEALGGRVLREYGAGTQLTIELPTA
jgi:two-component system sensor histidine kinase DesK